MAIFLTILKIIGIVLLCIIGLVIVIVLYLLFAPFWFRADGIIDRDMNYAIRGKATTFLHFIQVHINLLKDEDLDFYVTVSGPLIKVMSKGDKDKDSDEQPEDDVGDDDAIEADEATSIEESDKDKATDENVTDNVADKTVTEASIKRDYELEVVENPDGIESDSPLEIYEEKDDDTSSTNQSGWDKVKSFIYKFNPKTLIVKFKPETIKRKLQAKLDELKEKIKELRNKLDEILVVLKDNDNKAWVKMIFVELWKLIKSMKFNMRGTDLDFSLGSPDATGQACGALALFPPTYNNKVRIIPDFEDDNLYFDGNLTIKFRLQLIYVAILLIKVLMDENTKKILSLIK